MTVRDDQPDVSRSEKNSLDAHSAIDSDAASRHSRPIGSPTPILSRMEAGDASAADQLFPLVCIEVPPDELLALNEVLEQLAQLDTRAVEIVKLRCFAGLPIEQVAELLNTSTRTAYREWAYARAWIYRHLRDHRDSAGE